MKKPQFKCTLPHRMPDDPTLDDILLDHPLVVVNEAIDAMFYYLERDGTVPNATVPEFNRLISNMERLRLHLIAGDITGKKGSPKK